MFIGMPNLTFCTPTFLILFSTLELKNYGSEVILYYMTSPVKIIPLNQKLQEYTGNRAIGKTNKQSSINFLSTLNCTSPYYSSD
jgi:hypothetical protein